MNEVFEFLKKCGVYYLATCEGTQPRVRPFGALAVIDGKICMPTNNQKKVYQQLMINPKFELCGMHEGRWIRVEGVAELDDRREARVAMLEQCPMLSGMYNADDGLMVVFRIASGTATIASFEAPPEVYQL
jgi:uncharacterized pyridoxamine 5'-phosphate oxidase family protein